MLLRRRVSTNTASIETVWSRWLWFTFLTSLALSTYKTLMASTINNDGLLYLNTAQTFVEQGFHLSLQRFSWPFYPILIGLMHQVTRLSYEAAAHTLNGLLLAVLSTGFVAFYRELTDSKGLPWVAAAIILVSPQLNDYRTYIIRDIGYWTFALWALLHFVRFSRRGTWFDAIVWQSCIVVAIAFRIEGAAFAVLLPLWRLNKPPYGLAWLRSNSLFLLGIAIGIALWATQSTPLPANSRLDQLAYFLSWNHLGAGFAAKTEAIARHVQGFYAPPDARMLLIGGVLFLFMEKTLASLGLVYTSLLAWALLKKRCWLLKQPLLWYALGVSALPLLVFALNNLFLSGRYMGLLAILLSLPVAYAAEVILFNDNRILRQPRLATVLLLVLIALIADIFIQTGPSKRYIRDASDWVQNHVPSSHSLCSNDAAAYYYVGRGFNGISCNALEYLGHADLNGFDAFFVKLGHKDASTERELQNLLANRQDITLAAQFSNKAADKVYIILRNNAPPR